MGRKRQPANQQLGQHVQRRSDGKYELRFPLPVDVQGGFLDAQNRPRKQIIKSLGTSDPKLANERADAQRAVIRARVHKLREAQQSPQLDAYLRDLYEGEMTAFNSLVERDAKNKTKRSLHLATHPSGRGIIQ